jgi:hypothetical protein
LASSAVRPWAAWRETNPFSANFQCQVQKKDDLIGELEIAKQFETSTKAISDPN